MSAQHDRPQGAFGLRVEGTPTGGLPLFDHAPNRAGADMDLSRPRFETQAAPAAPTPEIDDPDLWAEFLEAEAESPYDTVDDWPLWANAFRIEDATVPGGRPMLEIVQEVHPPVRVLAALALKPGGRRRMAKPGGRR